MGSGGLFYEIRITETSLRLLWTFAFSFGWKPRIDMGIAWINFGKCFYMGPHSRRKGKI